VKCADGTTLWINSSGELMEVVYRDRSEPTIDYAIDDQELPHQLSGADGFKGFKMDENKRIIQFSDIYNRVEPQFFNIDGPILIDGKYYAVAEKGEASGVIDEEGNPLPGFDFVHKQLVWNRAASGRDTWFYYEDNEGNKGFINHKRQTKLAGELLAYVFQGGNMFDYGIQEGKDSFGVVDIQKMEWVIKPQRLYIRGADGTTKAACKKYTGEREDMIDVYFMVYDKGADPEEYYIDRNMKAYKPKR
jgi:hypothetical protein